MKYLFTIIILISSLSPNDLFYKVVNVANDDVLNMRYKPYYKSKLLYTLKPNEDCIELIFKEKKWAIVRKKEKIGWVNKRFIEKSKNNICMASRQKTNLKNNFNVNFAIEHNAKITGIAVNETFKVLASIDESNELIIRDLNSKKILIKKKLNINGSLVFSLNGKYLNILNDKRIDIFTFPMLKHISTLGSYKSIHNNLLGIKQELYQEKKYKSYLIQQGEKKTNKKNEFGQYESIIYGTRITHNGVVKYKSQDSIMDLLFQFATSSSRNSIFFVKLLNREKNIIEISLKNGKEIWSTKYDNGIIGVTGTIGPILVYDRIRKLLYAIEDGEYLDSKVYIWNIKKIKLLKVTELKTLNNIPFIHKYAKCIVKEQKIFLKNPYSKDLNCFNILKSIKTNKYTINYKSKNWIISNSEIKDRYLDIKFNGAIIEIFSKSKKLLATFYNKNDSWIAITPEGYFTGSKDAAKYLNITKYTPKRMEPFDFSQLYDHFFRPDLVKLKLSGNEEVYKKAIGKMTYQEALKNPPPKINFVSVDGKRVKNSGIDYDIVKTNKNRVKITFNIKEQKGGVGLIRIYQEGKLIKTIGKGKINRQSANLDTTIEQDKLNQEAKAKQKVYLAQFAKAIDKNISLNEAISKATQKYTTNNKAGKYTVEIELKSGKNEIGIEAFNKTNTVTSFRESITIDANIPKHKPKLYAIVAGVNKFEAKWASELKYSVNDAKAIKELAEKNMNKVFDGVEVKYLINQEVTKENIYKAIEDIATKAKLEDTILFFISTHGKAYKGRLFLVPQNNKNIANLINFQELFSKIQSIKSLNQIFIIDACESGEANDIVSSVYDSRASVLAKSSGVHLLLATTRGTYAFESQDPKIKHSMFTYKILQALKSKKTDLNKDNFISILELSKTLKQNQKSDSYQYPVIRNVGRDVRVEKVE